MFSRRVEILRVIFCIYGILVFKLEMSFEIDIRGIVGYI